MLPVGFCSSPGNPTVPGYTTEIWSSSLDSYGGLLFIAIDAPSKRAALVSNEGPEPYPNSVRCIKD